VVPDALVGVIVFAASVGPGYLFLRLAERREPRHVRPPLQEAAELVVVGAVATAIAIAVVLTVANWLEFIHPAGIVRNGGNYFIEEPARSLVLLCGVLALSYGGVWVLAVQVIYRGIPGEIGPSDSGWWGVFNRDLPEDHGIYLRVERQDGSAVYGALRGFTVESEDPRELTLAAPVGQGILIEDAVGNVEEIDDQFMILRSEDIDVISGWYQPLLQD
jgi:hypothetical protein